MATNLQSRRLACFGKRLVNQIRATTSSPDPAHLLPRTAATSIRAAHASAYDKNLDDQVRPTVVPDELIQPDSDKYWGPHPKTGVFGPTAEQGSEGAEEAAGGGGSVMEHKAWFRPLEVEDLEKPDHHAVTEA